ncbi:hypothetical protein LY28_03522 [Ruminiclostridium sufflavum DSM 19573]|uniref:Uncharacterized protein n=1 Tax=Ruminiclostridium sufflavum DSM 19573 TaxID=1121337 RepID=A0A318XGB1_9FIRM|nr:hypothetical protein LY28_03522 [Ruminiclostridium sufflavum DSM 19573]
MNLYKKINIIQKKYYSIIYLYGGIINLCYAQTEQPAVLKVFNTLTGILFIAFAVYYYRLRKKPNIKN